MRRVMFIGWVVSIMCFMIFWGCSTIPQGPPKPGVPRIFNLIVPQTVILGQRYPVSFQFEDSEGDITTVTLTSEWSWGDGRTFSESHTYDAGVFGKTNGTCEMFRFAGRLPSVFTLWVYVEDAKGNKSNILRANIATK